LNGRRALDLSSPVTHVSLYEADAFARWYAKYDAFRNVTRASARLENWETVALSLLQPAATILVLWLAWRLSRLWRRPRAGAGPAAP